MKYADLFLVYTYRALCHNVNVFHYGGFDRTSECKCGELAHHLHDFLKRAHHLSKRHAWIRIDEANMKSNLISPKEAGILFHIDRSQRDHFIEFPVICKVTSFGDEDFIIIFAQIPLYYWAFPLISTDSNQTSFSEEI